MNTPVVSIIMCFYNEEKYLSKAIDSVLNQTFRDFELIIINDGSTDRSEEIVQKYTDERIVRVRYEGNKRLAYARNRGLENARGKYIGFFDADDIMESDKLRREVEFLERNPEVFLVSGGYIPIDQDGAISGEPIYPKILEDKDIKAYMLFTNCICVGAALFRRDLWKQSGVMMDENNKASEDYGFWIDLLHVGKFANLMESFHEYRVNYGSKAGQYVAKNEEAYATEIKAILSRAWADRGIELKDGELHFLYETLFSSRKPKGKDFFLGIKTMRILKKELRRNHNSDTPKIMYYYRDLWTNCYKITWFFKHVVMKKRL